MLRAWPISRHMWDKSNFCFTDYPDVIKEYLDIETYVLINWNPTKGTSELFRYAVDELCPA